MKQQTKSTPRISPSPSPFSSPVHAFLFFRVLRSVFFVLCSSFCILSSAYAAPVQGGGEVNPLMSFVPLLFMFVIFYFLLIRPQQKRQAELQKVVQNLKKGDRVVTSGGVIGTVSGIQNDYVVLKVGEGEGAKMEVLKSAITGLRQN